MFRDDEFKESNNKENLFDRENLTGKNEEDPMTNMPVRVLTASSIIGDKVENTIGEKLGEIKDVMLNLQNGCIEYVVLQFGGIMGLGSKLFAVPFKSLVLNPSMKTFILNKDKTFLENAPGFDKGHWPETNSRHWNDVTIYWERHSIPPGTPF